LAATFFLTDAALSRAEACVLPPAFFVVFGFAGLLACFVAGRTDLAADFAGAAFFTGGFCATRLGLGFADLAAGLRFLAADFCEAPRGAGREELLFAPLMTGSLMRSTRFSQIASKKEADDLQQLNT
jgi:hypothetical protein